MQRMTLHSILLLGALVFSPITVANRPVNDGSVTGPVESFDATHGRISVDDTTYQMSPSLRIVDAAGRPVTHAALRRGARVKFVPSPPTSYGQLPVITEIQILSHAQ